MTATPFHADDGSGRATAAAREQLRAEATALAEDGDDRIESAQARQDMDTMRPCREPARAFGADQGRYDVPADFDAPLPQEIRRAFDGST